MQTSFQKEESVLEEGLSRMEERMQKKEAHVKRKEDRNSEIEKAAKGTEKEVETAKKEREELAKSLLDKLSETAKLKSDKALENAKKEIEDLISEGKGARHQAELEEYEEEIMRHAKSVIQIVLQRLEVSSSVDKNNTLVTVQDDSFKGLLIGKDACNITYLESLLPVSVIFNHGGDPKIINVAGLNLIRRNIAKRAINKLQKITKKTGRIDHKLIKETIEEAEKDVMAECDRKGRWALKQAGVDPEKTSDEVINYMGRLYFRTSYGQNQIYHSIEAGHAARMIAELIGVNIENCQTAAFYHDLGKSIDHDTGGSHDEISAEILEKNGYNEEIVYAALVHHGKGPDKTPTDYIVKAADAMSGSRPGARMEAVTNYFERMKELENLAKSFSGVRKVFTMSAGREVRVLVDKEQIKDDKMQKMADGIAEKISEEVSFPGIIKVNLIRQTKSVDYAREMKRSR